MTDQQQCSIDRPAAEDIIYHVPEINFLRHFARTTVMAEICGIYWLIKFDRKIHTILSHLTTNLISTGMRRNNKKCEAAAAAKRRDAIMIILIKWIIWQVYMLCLFPRYGATPKEQQDTITNGSIWDARLLWCTFLSGHASLSLDDERCQINPATDNVLLGRPLPLLNACHFVRPIKYLK